MAVLLELYLDLQSAENNGLKTCYLGNVIVLGTSEHQIKAGPERVTTRPYLSAEMIGTQCSGPVEGMVPSC